MAELSLVGSCILENKYDRYRYLQPQNFNKWTEADLLFIWDCLPGSLLEVSSEGRKRGRDIAYEVTYVTCFTSSTKAELDRIALGLMEDEYRRGFEMLLSKLIVNATSPAYKGALTEALSTVYDYSLDTFEMIGGSIDYLSNFCVSTHKNKFNEFMDRIAKKNDQIRVCHGH